MKEKHLLFLGIMFMVAGVYMLFKKNDFAIINLIMSLFDLSVFYFVNKKE